LNLGDDGQLGAIELLRKMAFLHSEGIQKDLFQVSVPRLPLRSRKIFFQVSLQHLPLRLMYHSEDYKDPPWPTLIIGFFPRQHAKSQ